MIPFLICRVNMTSRLLFVIGGISCGELERGGNHVVAGIFGKLHVICCYLIDKIEIYTVLDFSGL